jgi:SAM-dependent methyltransferase
MTGFSRQDASVRAASSGLIRLLRDEHHAGRARWPNFDTITTGAQYRHLHRLCDTWLPAGGHILDWGAGTGHASLYLSRVGHPVTGFSFEEFSFEDLLDGLPYRFVPGQASEPTLLPFADDEFDGALSVGVLEHVRETGGTEAGSLAELHRVLRRGGVLVCVHLPNATSWIEAVARRREGAHVHPYVYHPRDVVRMFEDAGFDIESRGRYAILPRNQVARIFPRALCDAEWFRRLYDLADSAGAFLVPWLTQNHFVVARAR